ncbi:MAG: hypothetical protein COW32_06485 [Candidatus Aquicultor secundus]|uniref:Uncharacterized protein n=1 Tax=Candidatus Aquicultor secundus TaxID=1973895 RepID=A0A2M7T512_9ACTN|nr:hypothetical protein [Candidatus Aquicultor secundus]OIO85412.1 MAG: hypothetical protein AUK32_07225 [Candidatus Aquicultor secundus]PIU26315.1 MAG: hypothetical protein COT10_09305 [Candidatus Aquicultor secundus]PIW22072.1 MAG: hypothetical protein COW32_06485 [Candidatus Aquicultor secundus]PIX51516.1 MAG: hypothetical protein COZ51_09105 [Candidatus Aquicultor secundus]PIY40033.1 MAG: hypothetical protein COZ03_04850 [Candidatus Aquicultor secundus]
MLLFELVIVGMCVFAIALLFGKSERSSNFHAKKAIASVSLALGMLAVVNFVSDKTEDPFAVLAEIYARVLIAVLWFLLIYHAVYAEIKDTIKRGEKELAALNDVAMAVGQSMDLSQILHDALLAVVKIANFEIGFIYLLNEEKNILELAASHGTIPENLARKLATLKPGQEV